MCFNRDCTSTWNRDIQRVLRLREWMREISLLIFENVILVIIGGSLSSHHSNWKWRQELKVLSTLKFDGGKYESLKISLVSSKE